MFKIPYVKPIRLVSPTGKPMFNVIQEEPDSQPREVPAMTDQFDFLMDRTTDAVFIEGLRGMDAQETVADARKELVKQQHLAPTREFWLLETVPAKRLLRAVEQGTYGALAYNHITFMRSVKAMEPYEETSETPQLTG